MQLTITPLAEAGVEVLPPDIVWLRPDGRPAANGEPGVVGDFAVATTPADGPAGGLVARNPLRSAILMLLFTDAAAEPWQLRPEHGGDARGWVGDGFDIDGSRGEAAMGSRLWLYRRAALTDQTPMEVRAEAERALQPLLDQGAAARIDVAAEADKVAGRILLGVDVYGRDGGKTFSSRFDVLWKNPDGL